MRSTQHLARKNEPIPALKSPQGRTILRTGGTPRNLPPASTPMTPLEATRVSTRRRRKTHLRPPCHDPPYSGPSVSGQAGRNYITLSWASLGVASQGAISGLSARLEGPAYWLPSCPPQPPQRANNIHSGYRGHVLPGGGYQQQGRAQLNPPLTRTAPWAGRVEEKSREISPITKPPANKTRPGR